MDTKLDGKAKKPSCQLCCKPNFPMKFIDSHFYHVTCLFMFDFGTHLFMLSIHIKLNDNNSPKY